MPTAMSTSKSAARRAILQTSRVRWKTDKCEIVPIISSDTRKCDEDSVEHWLTTISEDDTRPEVVLETAVKPIRRNESGEDDLALGVEASLYGKRSLRAVQDILRSSLDPPALTRWNSFASTVSIPSEVSVMDVLNIMQDDPEELLLDLGFGIEEPDITGRIPSRFINYQSSARGISYQLFLEAQQNRMDVENEDVRNRFRQLEVLQQVTTTFTSLVGASAQDVDTPTASQMSAEARERRKRMVMILRRAYKKSLSQAQTLKNQPVLPSVTTSAPESTGTPKADKRIPSKRTRMSDNSYLFPLEEEQSVNSEAAEPVLNSPMARGTSDLLKLDFVRSSTEGSLQRPVESFELEEIQSFDEGSIPGSCNGPADPGGERIGSCVMRTNSCQSDSSGFLEEPFIPALSQQNNPGPELMKMLNALSHEGTEGQQKRSVQGEAEDPPTYEQNSEMQSSQKHSPTHSGKTVLGTAESGNMFESDSGELKKIITEKENSLSSDIGKVSNNSVYTLAYFVQMDPVGYQTENRDRPQRSESPGRRVYREGMSLFEELKSAETNSCLSPTDLTTDVMENKVDSFTNHLEREPALDLMQESPASTQGKTMSSDAASGHNSPTALKLRRESFSRRSWSDGVTDNDSGTAQTPTTHTPFTSVDTCTPHLWNSADLGRFRTRSISLDTGLSYEEEDHKLLGALWAGEQRCFHCGSQINYGWAKPQTAMSSSLPYSLDELEDMMKCLRKFRTVLTEIEARLEEEQVSVFGSLSDSHREEVEDVLRLRAAVKQEAGTLEQQLSDLVHHYDDSIKMKLNRLMDEQSQLCTQLRITPSNTPHSEPTSTRSVAIQCCLLPVTSSPQRCAHHQCTCHGNQGAACQDPHRLPCRTQWDANCKPDRLDLVAFIKSLKNSLQHSINSNSLE